jgi:hypothetical protein
MSQPNNILTKTQQTYKNIIDKLIKEIKEAATSEGCSEDTLKELKYVRNQKFENNLYNNILNI